MEFPSNAYPWMLLAPRGVEHRRAPSRGGRVTADDIASVIDGRTRMVAISWVAFHNGWVYPLREIGALCREREILLVVDAIQGLGALPLDVRDGRSTLVADAHKWLLGPEAARSSSSRRARATACLPRSADGGTCEARTAILEDELDFFWGGAATSRGLSPPPRSSASPRPSTCIAEMGQANGGRRGSSRRPELLPRVAERGWKIASPEPLASGVLAAIPPDEDARGREGARESRHHRVAARGRGPFLTPRGQRPRRGGRALATSILSPEVPR